MRNQSTNSNSTEATLWFHSPHFSNGVKRPLCWRKQDPEIHHHPPPSPYRENVEESFGDLCHF